MGCCNRKITTTNTGKSAPTPTFHNSNVTNVKVKIKDILGAQLTYNGQTYGAGDTLILPSNLVAVLDVVELV